MCKKLLDTYPILADCPLSWQIVGMFRLFAIFLCIACPAVADTPLSADAFEAETTGRTLSYSAQGAEFGVEEYLPGRRVRWSYLDGQCEDGEWYPIGDMICFVYEDIPEPQCWSFYRESDGLVARFMNDPAATELYETSRRSTPLQCLGPEVGV